MENWCWEPIILKQFHHIITGEQLSDELISAKIASRTAFSGQHYLRQIGCGLISLKLYSGQPLTAEFAREIFDSLTPNMVTSCDFRLCASFGHLSEYRAGYYSYLWSKVYADDIYQVLKNANFSTEIGQRYVKCILSRGGSGDPNLYV